MAVNSAIGDRHEDLLHRSHSRRRHRHGSDLGRRRGAGRHRQARGQLRLQGRSLRLGRRILQEARPYDAGERPRADCQARCDPVRLGRPSRDPRPHHAVGLAARHLPAFRPVRQRAADARAARHHLAAARRQRRRARLGDRARELGGRIFRRRWPGAPGLAARGRHRRVDVHAGRRRAHHALRLQAGAVAAAQAPHRRHQIERPASRHGDVGRDRQPGGRRVQGRELGQDAGRRHDHAHGDAAAVDRHGGGDQPACRHPLRPRRGTGGIARHRADGEPQSRARLPVDVRADSRLGLRHHGQGRGQSGRHLLVGRDDAGASGREGRCGSPDEGDRARDGRQTLPHARPRRHGTDGGRDQGRDRGDSRRECVSHVRTAGIPPESECDPTRTSAAAADCAPGWRRSRLRCSRAPSSSARRCGRCGRSRGRRSSRAGCGSRCRD